VILAENTIEKSLFPSEKPWEIFKRISGRSVNKRMADDLSAYVAFCFKCHDIEITMYVPR